jgi:Fe-S-cluster containining protein
MTRLPVAIAFTPTEQAALDTISRIQQEQKLCGANCPFAAPPPCCYLKAADVTEWAWRVTGTITIPAGKTALCPLYNKTKKLCSLGAGRPAVCRRYLCETMQTKLTADGKGEVGVALEYAQAWCKLTGRSGFSE